MDLTGICDICGKTGKQYSCILCGKRVCLNCYTPDKGLCKNCKTGGRIPDNTRILK